MAWSNDDYVDVRQRIADFREKYPDGSLRPADLEHPYRVEVIGDQTFIVYIAAAYRTPDDTAPGIGAAWEPVPGKTNFTRDSELMNAETSAWGRAIVAAGVSDTKRSIASKDEVRARQGKPEEKADPEADALRLRLFSAIEDGRVNADDAQSAAVKHGVGTEAALKGASADVLRSLIETLGLDAVGASA